MAEQRGARETYDTGELVGLRLFDGVRDRLEARPRQEALIVAEERAWYGEPFLAKARLGQGAFRVLVTEAYGDSLLAA